MQLFPAIDLRGGKVVRLTQGDYDRMTVYGEDPCAQARAFLEAGAKNLHVVDLDGAKDGTLSNYDTIAALAKQGGLYIEVGGGIRTEERIEKYLSLGVGRCILGSVAVTNFDFTARMLKKYGEKIAVGVDAKDGYVAIHGWKDVSAEPGVAFCQRLAEAGCKAIIYTDIACDGAMKGTNLALYRQLAKEVPGVAITASGGISSEKELLFEKSYEYGEHDGLGFVPGQVCPLAPDLGDKSLKVPQIGWNAVHILRDDPLFKYVRDGEYFYYVHSYYGKNCAANTLAVSDYSLPVTGVVKAGKVYGTQFHPEKSGDAGLRLLKAFAEL